MTLRFPFVSSTSGVGETYIISSIPSSPTSYEVRRTSSVTSKESCSDFRTFRVSSVTTDKKIDTEILKTFEKYTDKSGNMKDY